MRRKRGENGVRQNIFEGVDNFKNRLHIKIIVVECVEIMTGGEMAFSLVKWWRVRQEKSRLKKDFLAERNDIVFLNAWGELEEDYDIAMKKVEERYVLLGLTLDDIGRIRRNNPFVRIE